MVTRAGALCAFLVGLRIAAAQGKQLSERGNVSPDQIGGLRSFQLLSSSVGWVLTGGQLLWTDNDGNRWEDIAPPTSPGDSVDTAFFLDAKSGWVFLSHSSMQKGTTFSIATTSDRGGTWSSTPVAQDDNMLRDGYGDAAYLSFPDAEHGWVLISEASSSASSIGKLYGTADGGKNWTALPAPPVEGKISFTSVMDGWLAGGAARTALYRTRDAGQHWTLHTVNPPANLGTETTSQYNLPSFDGLTGALPVLFANAEKRRALAIYATTDGGETWKMRHIFYNFPEPFGVVSFHGRAVAVFNRRGSVTLFGDVTTHSAAPLPNVSEFAGTRDVQFVDKLHGWLFAVGTQCGPRKSNCITQTALFKTEDGGVSFSPLLLDSAPLHPPASVPIPIREAGSKRQQPLGFPDEVIHLWQNLVFHPRVVGNPSVQCRNAPDRCIEICEELICNPSCDFGAIPPRQHILISDQHAAGLLDRRADRLPIVRRQRS